MKLDNYWDREIGRRLLEANAERQKAHISSGKLSASMLGQPLQWQILKIKGVEGAPIDEYVIRKFKRGNDIEDWFVNEIKPVERQKQVEYRDTIGFIDAICDTTGWDFPCGVIPIEVKSVSNAKYKRILKSGTPDRGHLLQACLYALAEKTDRFGIAYIAADDLRIHLAILETSNYKEMVDNIITRFREQLKTGKVPVFIAEESWHANANYNSYSEWMDLNEEQIESKLKGLNK